MPLFQLGKVVITPAASSFCNAHNIDPLLLISRHVNCDWGDLSEQDAAANVLGVQHELRIFSSYQFLTNKVWVITEADRSSTCILLPSDY
jgi:hypothetical protein